MRFTSTLIGCVLAALCATGASAAVRNDGAIRKKAEAEQAARNKEAEAAFDAAQSRCEKATKLSAPAKKDCLRKAKADLEAALRLAKIEKVKRIAELRDKRDEQRKTPPESTKERFAAAKARCEMMGTERDRCLAEAKKAFNHT